MKEFTYSPLDVSDAQIRLVHLLPLVTKSEHDSRQLELRCRIQTVSLDNDPEYTALSYTWGPPDRTSLLIIDDEGISDPTNGETAIRITKSLETALLHLRHPADTITLWIDQLCINQDDIPEKNSQVPLMGVIYEKARDVLVWLGPAKDESDHLLKFLKKVGKQASQAGLWNTDASMSGMARAFEVSLSEIVKPGSLGPGFTIPTESLRSFVNRDWWTRVWVVQEISVASSVKFACGAQRISYDRLLNALQFHAFYVLRTAEKFQTRHWILKLLAIRTILTLGKEPIDSAAMKMLSSSYKYKCQRETTGGNSLLRILELSHVVKDPKDRFGQTKLQATDARDKVFGLLGLANDREELKIQPDYGKDLSDVYIEVAKALIEAGQMDLLWFCQFPKSKDGLNLPTWTPDWTGHIQTPYGSNFSDTSRHFAASGNAKARIGHVDNDDRYINVQGVFVDGVDVIGSLWEEASGSSTQQDERKPSEMFSSKGFHIKTVIPFIQELNIFFDEALNRATGLDPSVIEEARWRTPIGDKEWEDEVAAARRATNQSREVYLEVCRRIEIQKNIPVSSQKQTQKRWFVLLRVLCFLLWMFVRFLLRRLYRLVVSKPAPSRQDNSFVFPIDKRAGHSYMTFMNQMYGRRPFRTQNGYVGLGPAHMMKGDIVCLILGAQVPYVLRPDGNSRHQLVG
jgi:hypothetical protein